MIQSTNLLVVVALGLVVLLWAAASPDESQRSGGGTSLEMLAAPPGPEFEQSSDAGLESAGGEPAGGEPHAFAVQIRRPTGPPLVELASGDPLGRVGQVACSTCHSVRKPNLENRDSSSLDEFHQGLKVGHGKLACYACHNPDDADSLRSADGSKISYQDVMQLCSQCHGPQATSFAHGAHGGMIGFWDLSQGPQIKNNCIDCHDPHSPSFPKMIVSFKPRDRFLGEKAKHDDHE